LGGVFGAAQRKSRIRRGVNVFTIRQPCSAITCSMPDEHTLALRHADQARTDFAVIESDLQFVMGQLARLPTRRDLGMTALGIIVSTAALVILWAEAFWHL